MIIMQPTKSVPRAAFVLEDLSGKLTKLLDGVEFSVAAAAIGVAIAANTKNIRELQLLLLGIADCAVNEKKDDPDYEPFNLGDGH